MNIYRLYDRQDVLRMCLTIHDDGRLEWDFSSVYRFLHRLEPAYQTAIVRVEREPGSEAQVDFG